MLSRGALLLCLVLLSGAACSTTDKDPVVVSPDSPDVSRRDTGPGSSRSPGEPALLDPNRVVARVNDQVITVRTLNAKYGANIRQLGDAGEAQIRSMLEQITEDFIAQVLVLEAARTLGVTVSETEFQQQIERIEKGLLRRDTTLEEDLEARGLARWEWEAQLRRELITEKLRNMLLGRSAAISPETRAIVDIWVRPIDVKNFYERNLEDFRVPEQASVDAIYLVLRALHKEGEGGAALRSRVRKLAEEIVAKARAGADFAELTKPYHEPGQYLAEPFGRGKNKPSVDEFVWDEKVAVGDISDPIELRSSFLILKLKSRQEAGYQDFEEVRELIEQVLQTAEVRLAQGKVQLALLDDAVITPRRFKVALENRYRAAVQEQIQILSK